MREDHLKSMSCSMKPGRVGGGGNVEVSGEPERKGTPKFA
jgi:hypothetical protein